PPAPLTKVTRETLAQVPDERLELALMAYIDRQIGPDRDKAGEALPKLPKGMQMLYATWVMESQVGEGGFNQYFWNPAGRLAPLAREGLTAFGATKLANVLAKAIEMEKREAPMMLEYKEKGTPEAFAESYKHTKLRTLDEEYKGIGENLGALRIRYIRAHPEAFVTE
ncbi:MAG: DUF4375 domain-containing protein, partial [Planctomycetota bacterium]|nr:DUF4375 domain-containing protein [Planctomycetota bacterium]